MRSKRWIKWGIPILACCVAASIGFVAGIYDPWQPPCNKYPLLESEYACGDKTQYINKGYYLTLLDDVTSVIQHAQAQGAIQIASFYFRDLEDGPAVGVNSNLEYAPASLLKLPMTLALFSADESQPGFLQTKLVYATSTITHIQVPAGIELPPVAPLVEGQSYTLEQLMQSSIVNSDNLAYYLLVDYVNSDPALTQEVQNSFQQIGILDPRTFYQQTLTTQEYASLFRLLYDVSYLNAQDSQTVLSWLSQSTFTEGIRAGVPSGVMVAEKWGLRNGTSTVELHDCGIVYYPNNPYSICVMTIGSDPQQLEQFIATVSQTVYKDVDAERVN